MANLNKVMLIGRLTRDPESRTFANGGKVTNFGFAVNNNKKNPQTGQWENVPVFVDCKIFNRGDTGKQADLLEQNVRKGHQLFIEGHLTFEQWDDKTTGAKRNALKVIVDNFQYLERREEGAGGGSYQRSAPAPRLAAETQEDYDQGPEPEMERSMPERAPDADIPF